MDFIYSIEQFNRV
jgi:hypothetical protein